MKAILIKFTVLSFMAVTLIGCGGGPKVQSEEMQNEWAGAPAWVLTPEVEGGLASVGSAKIGPAGVQFARTEAMANGRAELARIVGVKVKDLVENFQETTGIGDDQTVDKVATQVSQQVAKTALSGSKQKDAWISKSNTMYLFLVLDPEVAKNAIMKQAQTSFKNEKAMWQKFQAEKGLQKLEDQIDKEFGEFKGN